MGENDNIKFIGSTPGKIITFLGVVAAFLLFYSIISDMISGGNDL